MPCCDRTNEFWTSAKSIQMKTQAAAGSANRHNRQQTMQESHQFNRLAKRIGKDLVHTSAKMEKLTDLAKKKSLFEECSVEIEELSTIVRQDIAGLNKQIAQLQTYKNERFGAPSRSQGELHWKLVVVGLQRKLASVSKTFQNVLEMRTEKLKQLKNRREKFSLAQQVATWLPPSFRTGFMNSLRTHGETNAANSNPVWFSRSVAQIVGQTKSLDESKPNENSALLPNSKNAHSQLEFERNPHPDLDLSETEQMKFALENQQLRQRLQHSDKEVEAMEKQITELQRLQEVFAEKVMDQDKDILRVNEVTSNTVDNIRDGNELIRSAIKNSASRRVIF